MSAKDQSAAASEALDVLWDFNDPAASEQRFREHMSGVQSGDQRLAALATQTQIARAQGLQRRFDEAHGTLDEVEQLLSAIDAGADEDDRPSDRVAVRVALERGRIFNSSGLPDRARPLFERALSLARDAHLDALAIDAAHMLAIVAGSSEGALRWNRAALAMAETSCESRARRWRASLHNNIGWALHDAGEFAAAHGAFVRALELRREQGEAREIRIARWCVARSLRSMGRLDEALDMQRQLLSESSAADADGYVFEELAECLQALGRCEEARPHFSRAADLLGEDPWLTEREPERVARLRSLAKAVPGIGQAI